MNISNCWLRAQLEYRRRKRAWKRAGMPAGEEPYYLKRPSRNNPRGIDHRFVGAYDKWSDQVRVTSFKPAYPTDVSWWLGWKHLLFRGRVEHGDWPRTVPADDDCYGPTENG